MNEPAPVCLVTGASRGIGYHTARMLGMGGAQVIAVARTVGGLEELDDAIQGAGGGPAVLTPLDLTDGDGLDRMRDALLARFGRLDLLIHAAAAAAPLSPVAHAAPKDVEAAFAVNALATHRLIRALDPLLRLTPAAKAVFLTDEKADQALWGAYGASKAAMAALARSYAVEATGVEVTLWAPPACATALRGRTHPGEDPATLTRPEDAARALLAEIGWLAAARS